MQENVRRRGQKLKKIYLRWVVKSPLFFYAYLMLFMAGFLIAATELKLERRQAYRAQIQGDMIKVTCEGELRLYDDKVYVYVDRNQKVFAFEVKGASYREGVMYLALSRGQEDIWGNVTVEIISGRDTLFQRIIGNSSERISLRK